MAGYSVVVRVRGLRVSQPAVLGSGAVQVFLGGLKILSPIGIGIADHAIGLRGTAPELIAVMEDSVAPPSTMRPREI